jgi:hypothetical protein
MRGCGASRIDGSRRVGSLNQAGAKARPLAVMAGHLLLVSALLLQILASAGHTHAVSFQAATILERIADLTALDSAIGEDVVLCAHGDGQTNNGPRDHHEPCEHDGACCQTLMASFAILPPETAQSTAWLPVSELLSPTRRLSLKAALVSIAPRPRGPPISI